MSTAQKIIQLYNRRQELERELSQVKERLSRIALAVDDKGISKIKADGESLDVAAKYYATYYGKESGGIVLHGLGLTEFVYLGYTAQGLGRHLRTLRDMQDGDTFNDCFVLRRVAWFQK